MLTEQFADRELRCEACAKRFVWTADAQAEAYKKAFWVPPSRCRPCRKARYAQADAEAAKCARQAQLDALDLEFAIAIRAPRNGDNVQP